jgi:hypothetical protein
MAQYLADHPDIFVARKEMHLFGGDLRFGRQFYRRSRDAYLEEFGAWRTQLRGGEASVWYLFSTLAADEIKAFNPDARVIVMLREPANMLHSLYCQFRFDGNEHITSFEGALAAEDDRRAGRRIGRQTYLAQGLMYRETARYTEQIRRYFEVLGRDRVHVIIYDDLVADTAGAYRKALEFLEVDPAFVPARFAEANGNKYVKQSVMRAILNDPLLRSAVLRIRPWLPRAVFSGLQRMDARLRVLNSRTAGRAPLAPGLQRQLRGEFAGEVESLSLLLGRDLTHWNRENRLRPGMASAQGDVVRNGHPGMAPSRDRREAGVSAAT